MTARMSRNNDVKCLCIISTKTTQLHTNHSFPSSARVFRRPSTRSSGCIPVSRFFSILDFSKTIKNRETARQAMQKASISRFSIIFEILLYFLYLYLLYLLYFLKIIKKREIYTLFCVFTSCFIVSRFCFSIFFNRETGNGESTHFLCVLRRLITLSVYKNIKCGIIILIPKGICATWG